MIYTLMCRLSQGRRAALFGALGGNLSILPYSCGDFGLAAVPHASALQLLNWAGGVSNLSGLENGK
jgi:threonine/homoserine/homoserine lactone efflux protein